MPWIVVIAVCLVSLHAETLPPGRQHDIERMISQEMARQNIPAVSISVAAGGEILWSSGFGLADLENYVPAKGSTVYRLGSISKPITAVAALQLVETGKMQLDASVRQYVSAFPRKPWPITIRQLLGHLGGIRHYDKVEEINSTRHYPDLASALKTFQDDPLVAEPGTRFHYTTYGYVLLGAAIESASSLRYMDYLRQKVFAPAGMERMRQDHTFAIIPNRARGYTISPDGRIQNCSLADTSNKIPGGGLASTADDLVKFALAVRKGTLLKRATVDLMFTPLKLQDGKPTTYGLGWNVSSLDGRKIVSHTGGQQGVSTILAMLPKEGVVVALLTNLERATLRDLTNQIARSLVDLNTSRAPSRPATPELFRTVPAKH